MRGLLPSALVLARHLTVHALARLCRDDAVDNRIVTRAVDLRERLEWDWDGSLNRTTIQEDNSMCIVATGSAGQDSSAPVGLAIHLTYCPSR